MKDKEGKLGLKCSCGYTSSTKETAGYKVKFPIRHTEKDYIVVVEEDEDVKKRKKREVDEDERQEMLELMLDYFPED
jgi:hypothetical protein